MTGKPTGHQNMRPGLLGSIWSSLVHKVLFAMGSAFNDRERGKMSHHIFRGTFSSRESCQRDELRHFINWWSVMIVFWVLTDISLSCIEISFSESPIKENWEQKLLASTMWSASGIHSFLALAAKLRYNAEFFKHLFFLTSREPMWRWPQTNASRHLSASQSCTTWQGQTIAIRNDSNGNQERSQFG
jgi:hypothetical protein